ncbi:interferon omega-1 [Nannospalax galili]|uniref:interferon omega-1 n=1 Tax=Nannospalax galili TaxID=1026970 RepID=UPI0004ED4E32|nr:interferon omega-1 [Nannospalax galili]
MALLFPLLATLLACNYGPVGSLGCDLPRNSDLLTRKTFVLLGQMRRVSPFLCLKDRRNFQFLQELLDDRQIHRAQAVSVLHEMLQQIFNIFHTEHAAAAWNTPLLDELRMGLHQQLETLKTCLIQVIREEDFSLAMEDQEVALRKYFRGIHLYLDEKSYSDCAWEIVRVETVRAFSSVAKLQERLIKAGDLGSS